MTRLYVLSAFGVLASLVSCADRASPPQQQMTPPLQPVRAVVEPVRDVGYSIREGRLASATTARVLVADHSSMGLHSEFSRGQVLLSLAARAHASALRLQAEAWGCAGHMDLLAAAEPEQLITTPERVSYSREAAAISEWYEHGPKGLEHGYTVTRLPGCAERGGTLRIQLASSQGWSASVTDDGARAAFRDGEGGLIHYSDAHAFGAQGAVHAVKLVKSQGGIALEVDVRDVKLPLLIDPLAWVEQQKVVASDAALDDYFGASVAVSGALLAVGAAGDDDKGTQAGAVYAYTRTGTTWAGEQKLVASDGQAGDLFGTAVANDGTYLAVGANEDDDGGDKAGSAYVFSRVGNAWGGQKKIAASDPQAGDRFGCAVAVDGNTLLVGANQEDERGTNAGAAYVYTFSAGNWSFQQKLMATDLDAAYAGDGFGLSVAISGDTAVVGANYDSQGASLAGAAYVFLRTGPTWAQQAKLVADDASSDDYAGQAVSISGNTLVIGANGDAEKALGAGSAYVFTRSNTTWTKQQKLFAKSPAAGHQFGWAAAVRGDNLVIGAIGDTSVSGFAYVFGRTDKIWTELTKLAPSNPVNGANYGSSVSLDVTTVAIGSSAVDAAKGAAYVGSLKDGSPCSAGTECDSGNCVEGVCCDAACAGTCKTCLASRKASGADGACGNVTVDKDPRNQCAAQADTTCGTTGVCNGSGACSQFSNGTECAAASCSTKTSENPKDSCNGSGSCVATNTKACGSGYVCEGGVCHTDCTSDAECDAANGFECQADHTCKIPQGAACTKASDCATGFCADSVCCDKACDDPCIACTAAFKGSGDDGVCGAVAPDRDVRGDCEADVDICGADGSCDGEGACRSFAKPTQQCGATQCSDGLVSGSLCDGQGTCGTTPVPCVPYKCADAVACGTTCTADVDCTPGASDGSYAGAFCNGLGGCQEKLPDGESCGATKECASGNCVDGVCCNQPCAGQCEACGEKASPGKCVAVQDEPRGARPACDVAPEGEPCSEVSCNGVERKSCAGYVGSKVVCQAPSCQDGLASGTGRCDGAGQCAVDAPKACDPYACGATECLLGCETNDDCVNGNTCIMNECRTGSRCNDDNTGVIDSMSVETSCGQYVCKADECVTKCVSSNDCAAGYLCDVDTGACEAVSRANVEDAGCGCRAAGGASGRAGWPLVGLGLLLARRRPGGRQSSRPT